MSRTKPGTFTSSLMREPSPTACLVDAPSYMAFEATCHKWNITVYGHSQLAADEKLKESIARREKHGEFVKGKFNGSVKP